MEITKFVVNRSRWLRGEGFERSFLLRQSDSKMCCFGFLAMACGYTENEIKSVREPCSVKNTDLFPLLIHENENGEVDSLMDINDDADSTNEQREQELTELFKELNIEIVFED